MRIVPLISSSTNWRSFTRWRLPIIMHSIGLSWRIFLTVITSRVHSLSTSDRYFSEVCTLDLGADDLELISRGTRTAGLSVRNLHHGFGVIHQASFFIGKNPNFSLVSVRGNKLFHDSTSFSSNHPYISDGSHHIHWIISSPTWMIFPF